MIWKKKLETKETGLNIALIWIHGYYTIKGNEQVDKEAKKKAAIENNKPSINITTYANVKKLYQKNSISKMEKTLVQINY